MNALLARVASFINALVGLVIIFAGALVAIGIAMGDPSETPDMFFGLESTAAAVIVFVLFVVVAAIICGLVAYLSEIERHLREIKQIQGKIPLIKAENSDRVAPRFD